ncbi:MAG: polymer-forming cytoskeletal protein [Proteobacteria bacterium]|nr:polymer-forming cytoskeletal protein [Pseudomonadota bacterium]
MSLFRRKSSEEAEPTLDARATAERLEATPSAALKEPIDTPAADNTQIDAALSDPDKRLSDQEQPNQGALMASNRSPSAGFVPEIPRRSIDLPGAPGRRASTPQRHGNSEGKRLVVGKDISLSGEIKACDSLIVEGSVEATLENSQFLEITEGGVFVGTVVIDEAVIAGSFEGTITARERLTIKSTGRIKGNVRFKQIEIDLGGEIDGDVHVLKSDTAADSATP